MNLKKISTEDLLKEVQRRNENNEKEKYLVFGSIGNDLGVHFVEVFKMIKKPEDLSFLGNYSLRVRFNPHRNIKGFYFNTDEKSFQELVKTVNENSELFAEYILSLDSETISFFEI